MNKTQLVHKPSQVPFTAFLLLTLIALNMENRSITDWNTVRHLDQARLASAYESGQFRSFFQDVESLPAQRSGSAASTRIDMRPLADEVVDSARPRATKFEF